MYVLKYVTARRVRLARLYSFPHALPDMCRWLGIGPLLLSSRGLDLGEVAPNVFVVVGARNEKEPLTALRCLDLLCACVLLYYFYCREWEQNSWALFVLCVSRVFVHAVAPFLLRVTIRRRKKTLDIFFSFFLKCTTNGCGRI